MEEINQSQEPNQSETTSEEPNAGAIRRSQTAGILSALSTAAGQQFATVEDAVAAIARLSATQKSEPQAEPKQTSTPAKTSRPNDLQDRLVKLETELAKREQVIREQGLNTEITRAMGDRFDQDLMEYATTKVKENIQWNTDGTYSIVNNRGQERYSNTGEPMTIDQLVQEVAQQNPKLLRSATTAGSGLRSSGITGVGSDEVIPDYSRDPAAFNAWAARNGLGKKVGLKGVQTSVQVSNSSKRIL